MTKAAMTTTSKRFTSATSRLTAPVKLGTTVACAVAATVPLSSSALAQTLIPSVSLLCDTCTTYTDIQNYAQANAYLVGVGITPSGFPAGSITQPGYTKILVSARRAPLSYVFDYTATRGTIGGFLSQVVYYTYTVTPTTGFPANDTGAALQDQQLFKALRASGLPTVQIPRTNDAGSILNLLNTPSLEAINAFVSGTLFTAMAAPLPRFRQYYLGAGLAIEIIYDNKRYTVFNGDTFQIRDADGNTADVEFTLGTFGSSVGYVKIKINTIKPASGASQSTAPAPGSLNGLTLNALDPATLRFEGIPVILINGPIRNLTPSVTVRLVSWSTFVDLLG